jgi:hypothetical protein
LYSVKKEQRKEVAMSDELQQNDLDIIFPRDTLFIKREWITQEDAPGLPRDGQYYIVRDEEAEDMGIFESSNVAFEMATRSNHILLWAH